MERKKQTLLLNWRKQIKQKLPFMVCSFLMKSTDFNTDSIQIHDESVLHVLTTDTPGSQLVHLTNFSLGYAAILNFTQPNATIYATR
jgi:hypothetical protein